MWPSKCVKIPYCLWYAISHQQTYLAPSNSVCTCIWESSLTSSKMGDLDLDLLFQGHILARCAGSILNTCWVSWSLAGCTPQVMMLKLFFTSFLPIRNFFGRTPFLKFAGCVLSIFYGQKPQWTKLVNNPIPVRHLQACSHTILVGCTAPHKWWMKLKQIQNCFLLHPI